MKGGASQSGPSGGFGQSGIPPWLGMAGQYGGYGGYGGYGQGMAGQAGQMGGPPMTSDFSQGAGLYQANQAAPYYAGGQPPPQPGQPPSGTPSTAIGSGGFGAPTAGGTPSTAIGAGGTPYTAMGGGGISGGLLGTGTLMGTAAGPGGLLNGAGYPSTTNTMQGQAGGMYPGLQGQASGMMPGQAGGNMYPGSPVMPQGQAGGMMPSQQNPQTNWMSQWHNRGYGTPGVMPGQAPPGAYYGLLGGGGY